MMTLPTSALYVLPSFVFTVIITFALQKPPPPDTAVPGARARERYVVPIWLIVLAVLSALTWTPLGDIVATITAISVIGLPITALVFVLPTMTVALALILVPHRALRLMGVRHGWIVGVVLCGVLALMPPLVAARMDSTAQALAARDHPFPSPLARAGTIVIDSPRTDCDAWCRDLLDMGFDGVITARAPDYDRPEMPVTLHRRVVTTKDCATFEHWDRNSPWSDSRPGQETCILRIPATLAEGTVALVHEKPRPKAPLGGRFDFVIVSRLMQRVDGRWQETGRRSRVIYDHPILPLISRSADSGMAVRSRPGLMSRRVTLGDDSVPTLDTVFLPVPEA